MRLTDPYWFKPEGAEAVWAEINYFDNGYDEAFGDLLLDGAPDAARAECDAENDRALGVGRAPAITRTSDSTTDGMLAKRWVREDGEDFLIKGGTGNENREPFNERLATCLLERLLEADEFVRYEVVERHSRAYSSCKNMAGPDAELESRPYVWECHPFREYPSQQLALVEDLSWYDPSALDGFADDIAKVLGENPEIDERFIAAVQKQTARQIESVNNLAAERGFVAAGW